MKTDQLKKDIDFLRRRQKWLEERIEAGGDKSYDVKEALALNRVLGLLENAVKRADGMK